MNWYRSFFFLDKWGWIIKPACFLCRLQIFIASKRVYVYIYIYEYEYETFPPRCFSFAHQRPDVSQCVSPLRPTCWIPAAVRIHTRSQLITGDEPQMHWIQKVVARQTLRAGVLHPRPAAAITPCDECACVVCVWARTGADSQLKAAAWRKVWEDEPRILVTRGWRFFSPPPPPPPLSSAPNFSSSRTAVRACLTVHTLQAEAPFWLTYD